MDGEGTSRPTSFMGGEASTPVFDDLNRYEVTTHFNGQSTVTLDGDRATGESYTIALHVYTEEGTQGHGGFAALSSTASSRSAGAGTSPNESSSTRMWWSATSEAVSEDTGGSFRGSSGDEAGLRGSSATGLLLGGERRERIGDRADSGQVAAADVAAKVALEFVENGADARGRLDARSGQGDGERAAVRGVHGAGD